MPKFHPAVKSAMDSATKRMDEWSEAAREKAAEARRRGTRGKKEDIGWWPAMGPPEKPKPPKPT